MRVGLLGAGGKMGTMIARGIVGASDLELVAGIDPHHAGTKLAESDLVIAASLDALVEAGAEAVVDFTEASAARENIVWCAAHNIHVVCGTTGLREEDLEAFRPLFGGAGQPNCLIASNFAITAALMMRFSEIAARYLDGVEIVELHHDEKRDAPSGTALETAHRIAHARETAGAGAFSADPTADEVLTGARGGVGPGDIHVHSIRLPGLIAHQEVLFGAPGQALRIRQDSFDRNSFLPGVLLGLRKVATTPGLSVGLDALLDI